MMRMNFPVICMVAFFFACGVAMARQTRQSELRIVVRRHHQQ